MIIPAQVLTRSPGRARVATDSRQLEVICPEAIDARPGAWVLVYAGQIVELVSADEARAVRGLLSEVIALGGPQAEV